MSKEFDVVVIGAGPAGYVAAIRCAQLGLKVGCIDNWTDENGGSSLGGTCLNAGCIPSKALLESSEAYYQAKHHFDMHGVEIKGVSIDLNKMQARKETVVKTLTTGIEGLFKTNKITKLHGHGRLSGKNTVEFTPEGATTEVELLKTRHVILASGSTPIDIGAAPVDGEQIVDSWGAQNFTEVPKTVGVIGAGVIGLELGSVWARLGSKVVLLEAQDSFLPMADKDIAQQAERAFKKQGLDIRLGARVTQTDKTTNSVTVHYEDSKGAQSLQVDKLIVAVGRRPNTDNLFSAEAGLTLDEKGYVNINEYCRTNLPDVYAIGDVVRGPMLAHKGSEEGVAVAETIAGIPTTLNHDVIPSVIYTAPEVAWVGKTEQMLKSEGIEFLSGSFPFAASGRAQALGETSGLVKVLADAQTDEVLGVHIFGHAASELIAEAVVAMEFGASSEDLARTIHAHPTLSEAVHEAALAVDKRAIHIRNR